MVLAGRALHVLYLPNSMISHLAYLRMCRNITSRIFRVESLVPVVFRFAAIIAVSFFVSALQAQFPKLWKTGKVKDIGGYSILREEGPRLATPYIYFEGREGLMEDMQSRAEMEMWTPEEIQGRLSALEGIVGYVHLKIVGSSIEAANTENFSVIIQDMDGNELYRERLEPSVPDYEVLDLHTSWTNYGSVSVPGSVSLPFRVFIVDHYQTEPEYKRRVYVVSQGELRASPNQSESARNKGAEVLINVSVGDRVRWMDSGTELEGVVSNVSGSRCAIEYQNAKGKTKTAVLSVTDVFPVEEE